jgi:hypothetical protein
VVLDAELLGSAGKVVVRADPNCTQATITISTADQTGRAADAVRGATLSSTPDGRITASAEVPPTVVGPTPGAGNIIGDGYVVHNGNVNGTYFTNSPNGADVRSTFNNFGNGQVIQVPDAASINIDNGAVNIQSITGSAFSVSGGNVSIDGNNVSFDGNNGTFGPQTSPIEITAVVPEGSSVECSTDRADLETHGKLNVVEARSAAGSVSVDEATDVTADTASGDISVDSAEHVRADSASGSVSVDSTKDVTANTASGDISVDSAEHVRADSASGSVTVGNAKDVKAATATGKIDIRTADKAVAKSATGQVTIGSTKNAVAKSRYNQVEIKDLRGTARAESETGTVKVHATEGGKVTAGSTTGQVRVTASDKAIADGLTVTTQGPPRGVSVPEGANTGAGASRSGSDGARDLNSSGRTGPSRDTGTGLG